MARNQVLVTLSDEDLALLDHLRGPASRQDYVRALLRQFRLIKPLVDVGPDAAVPADLMPAPTETQVPRAESPVVTDAVPRRAASFDCPHPAASKSGRDCRLCGAKGVHR